MKRATPNLQENEISADCILDARGDEKLEAITPLKITGQLRNHGMVLLRGFASSLESFEQFTDRFCKKFHQVGTRQVVTDQASDGHTSQVPQSNISLFAHSEGAYRPCPPPPDLCFFNCVQPPSQPGGETLLVDGKKFLQRIPGPLLRRFEQQGIIYQALWSRQRWQTEFRVDSLEQVDDLLLEYPRSSYQIIGENMLVRCHLAAIQTTLGGVRAFANGLLAHLPYISHPRWHDRNAYSKDSNRVFFGDGEEIPDSAIEVLIDIQDEIAIPHAWKANDLLILDNLRIMHGRLMTEGDVACERQIRSRFGRLKNKFRD
jgi:alpha-ketoglutarate-dependent taurine dioxygenase